MEEGKEEGSGEEQVRMGGGLVLLFLLESDRVTLPSCLRPYEEEKGSGLCGCGLGGRWACWPASPRVSFIFY